MKIQQLIERLNEMIDGMHDCGRSDRTNCTEDGDCEQLRNFVRKLIEAVGEELIGYDSAVMWAQSDNALRAKQRLKLKEILSNIK